MYFSHLPVVFIGRHLNYVEAKLAPQKNQFFGFVAGLLRYDEAMSFKTISGTLWAKQRVTQQRFWRVWPEAFEHLPREEFYGADINE